MHISKRLPNIYQTNFAEYRYFRCGPESFAMAIWFGLLEVCSSLPIEYREKLIHRVATCSDPNKKSIVHWMMQRDEYVSQSDRLSVWNCRDGYRYLYEIFQELVAGKGTKTERQRLSAFCDDMRIVVTNFNPNSGSPAPPSVSRLELLIYTAHSTEAMLCYRDFNRDSFYVSICRHVNLKRTLLTKVAEKMQQSTIGAVDFSQMRLPCICSEHILKEVLGFMIQDVDAISEDKGQALLRTMFGCNEQRRFGPLVCRICSGQMSQTDSPKCKQACQVCENCLLINHCTISYPWCPVCSTPLSSDTVQELSNSVVSMGISELLSPRCSISQGEKCVHVKMGNVTTHFLEKIGHYCQMCDECWNGFVTGGQIQNCPVCKVKFCDRDRPILELQIDESRSTNGLRFHLCACEVKLEVFAQCKHLKTANSTVWLYNQKAMCTKCILRQDTPAKCQSCTTVPNLKCAKCGKVLALQSTSDRDRMETCCEHGCILCFFCIYKDQNSWKCGRCNSLCLETRKDPKWRRKQYLFGCCEVFNYSMMEIADCGHALHLKCPKKCSICQMKKPTINARRAPQQ